MRHNYYKSVHFYDIAVYCTCRGIKDNSGNPIRYRSPLDINVMLDELAGMKKSFSEPLAIGKNEYYLEEFLKENKAKYVVKGDENLDKVDNSISEEGESEPVDLADNEPDPAISRMFNSSTLDVYLQDVKQFPDFFVLLINFTNLKSAHSVVRDISSGQRNENNLTHSEGGDHSAHIVIFKEKKGDRQVCLVERTNGLQGAALKSFFDYIGKLVAEENTDSFTIDHPEGLLDNKGRVKKRMILPKFNFHGYPSEQFFEDLENGRMNSISLVGEANQMRGIGDDLPPEFREVAIQLDADLSKLESWREFIGRNITYGKEYNLEKLRVKFTDASGSSHTTEIEFDDDLNDGNLKYVKKRRVGMSFRPKSSYDQVNVNFLKKMLEVCDG